MKSDVCVFSSEEILILNLLYKERKILLIILVHVQLAFIYIINLSQGRIQYEAKDAIASLKNWSFRFKEYEDLKILTLKIHTFIKSNISL